MLYEGLLTSKTHGVETRVLSKILTKIEDIGVQKEKSLLYTLAEAGEVKLEDSEFDLLKRLLDNVEWNGTGAKLAGAMLLWLDNVK